MAHLAYYASHISDNILDQGKAGIICLNVPLARTGWQTYFGKELGADFQKEYNVGDEDKVKVYRSPEEVLKPEAIASFETKTVCDNHPPNRTWVDGDNYKEFLRGHVQNVRKGEKEVGGEDVIIGDLAIIDAALAKEILDKVKREISCGYDYKLKLRPDGNFEQVDIRGNHVAVVPSGRAGDKVRINDAAPAEGSNEMATMTKPTGIGWSDFLRAVGLKSFATDAKPEELAEAQKELQKEGHMPEDKKRLSDEDLKAKEDDLKRREDDLKRREEDMRRRDDDKRDDDKRGRDRRDDDRRDDDKRGRDRKDDDRKGDDKYHRIADKLIHRMKDRRDDDVDTKEIGELLQKFFEEEGEEPQHQGDRRDDDKRGRDHRDDDRRDDDRRDDDKRGRDRRDDDRRRGDDRRDDDVDIPKLAEMLKKFFSEESGEAAHRDDDKRGRDRRDDDIEPIDNPAELKKKEGEDAEVLEPVEEYGKKEKPDNPIPGADADALREFLIHEKPEVARSKDKARIAKFNRALDSLQGPRMATTRGGYGALTNLTHSQGTDSVEDRNAVYAEMLNKQIGRNVGQKEA
jgi:hypothetical protein